MAQNPLSETDTPARDKRRILLFEADVSLLEEEWSVVALMERPAGDLEDIQAFTPVKRTLHSQVHRTILRRVIVHLQGTAVGWKLGVIVQLTG